MSKIGDKLWAATASATINRRVEALVDTADLPDYSGDADTLKVEANVLHHSATPLALSAYSEEDANEMALDWAYTLYPRAHGWDGQKATVVEVGPGQLIHHYFVKWLAACPRTEEEIARAVLSHTSTDTPS